MLAALLGSLLVVSAFREQATVQTISATKKETKSLVVAKTGEHGKDQVTLIRAATRQHSKTHKQSPDDEAEGEDDGDASAVMPQGGGGLDSVLGAVQAEAQLKSAEESHAMIHQFMHNFATNMRYAVLEDSKGDIPEEERQRLMHKIEAERGGPPMQLADDPAIRRRPHHAHMLNAEPRVEEHLQAEEEGRRPRHAHMLNSEFRGGPSKAGQMAAADMMKRSHEEFMDRLNQCMDEDCIKHLYAVQARRREQIATHLRNTPEGPLPRSPQIAADMPTTQESSDGDDEPSEVRNHALIHRSSADDDEPDVIDADEDPPPATKSVALKVRDAMGRSMPLLFGGQPSRATHQSSSIKKRASLASLALVFLSAAL